MPGGSTQKGVSAVNEHPLPNNEPDDPVLLTVQTFAEFGCMDCYGTFVTDIPGIREKLPRCPICSGASQISRILLEF